MKMPLNFYCAYDSNAGHFMSPFLMRSDAEAMRSFRTLVNDPATLCGKYPGDFHLYRIGSYDDALGHLLPTKAVSLGVGLAFINGGHDANSERDETPIRPSAERGNSEVELQS